MRLHSIDLKKMRINDSFWSKHVNLVSETIIPYQWNAMNDLIPDAEASHCLDNFAIAAGRKSGEFYGAVFQDTDVAKWLEAVGFTLAAKEDQELEKTADEAIDLIAAAQQEDGYLDTYFIIKSPEYKWKNLCEGHELYTAGHMMEAAAAYYQGTGKRKLLDVVEKLGNLLCETFGPEEEKLHGYPGHPEVEVGLIKLYYTTGKKKYLDLAKYFVDVRGVGENYFLNEMKSPDYQNITPELLDYRPEYSQSDRPVREQERAEGHAVRAVYLYSAMAELAYEYQDQELMDACVRIWNNIVKKQMYITGGIGASGILERFTTDYDLPNDCNYSESCASIGLAMFGIRMANITRDASYIDTVERALYNTILAGIALDGKSFFYVNPLEVWPDNCMERTSKEHVKPIRQKWFGVACCPPNIARTLASLGQYVYSAGEGELYVNLFISNQAEIDLGNTAVQVSIETRFPFENVVHITVEGVPAEGMKLAVRIPEYARNYTMSEEVRPPRRGMDCGMPFGYTLSEEDRPPRRDMDYGMPSGYTLSEEVRPPRGGMDCGMPSGHTLSEEVRPPRRDVDYGMPSGDGRLSRVGRMDYKTEKGYAVVMLTQDTKLTVSFDAPARFIRANPNVRADCGKTAVTKGPLVYCLEEIDNGKNLAELYVDTKQEIREEDSDLFGGIKELVFQGKRIEETAWDGGELYGEHPLSLSDVTLKAVPYAYWNNRGMGEMSVWMKELVD